MGSQVLQHSSISQKRVIRWSREAPEHAGWIRGGISPAYGSLLLFQGPGLSRTHVILPTTRRGKSSLLLAAKGRPYGSESSETRSREAISAFLTGWRGQGLASLKFRERTKINPPFSRGSCLAVHVSPA